MHGLNPDIHQIILNLANSSLGANSNFIRPQNLASVPIPTHDPQLFIHQPHFTNLFAARLAQGLTLNNVAQAGLNSAAPNVHPVQSSRFAVPHSHPNQIFNRINDVPPSDFGQNVLQFSPAVTQPQYMTFPVSQPFANPGSYYPTQANQSNISNQSTNNTIPNTYNGILVAPPVAAGQPLISSNNQHAYVVHHGQFINQPQSQTSANEFLTHSVNGTNVSHSDTLLNSNPGVSTHLPVVQTIQGIPPQVAQQYNPAHINPGMNSFITSLGEFQVAPNIDNNPNPTQPHLFSTPSGIAPNPGIAGPRTILPQNPHPSFNQPNMPHAGIYQHQGAYPTASFRLPQHPLLQPKVATNGPPIPTYPLRGVPHFNMGQINSQMLNNSPILKGVPRFIGFKLAGQPIVSSNSGLHSNIGVSSTSNNGVSVESTVSSVRSEDRIMPTQINE